MYIKKKREAIVFKNNFETYSMENASAIDVSTASDVRLVLLKWFRFHNPQYPLFLVFLPEWDSCTQSSNTRFAECAERSAEILDCCSSVELAVVIASSLVAAAVGVSVVAVVGAEMALVHFEGHRISPEN